MVDAALMTVLLKDIDHRMAANPTTYLLKHCRRMKAKYYAGIRNEKRNRAMNGTGPNKTIEDMTDDERSNTPTGWMYSERWQSWRADYDGTLEDR